MRAVLNRVVPLFYRTISPGLPPHVRSGSALRRWGSRLAVVQDDVLALAILHHDGVVDPLLLPTGADGARLFDDRHGNKHAKLDLEAALTLPDGRLLAIGSGATPMRERIVIVSPEGIARIHDAASLYVALRDAREFSGGELNIEGAVLDGNCIRLFQRGNTSAAATNAIGDIVLDAFLDWLDRAAVTPSLNAVRRVDLGAVHGVPYGFTDATAMADGRVAFLACAEDSADAVHDGPVLGCLFGVLDRNRISLAHIVDAAGQSVTFKLEGIESRPGDDTRFDVVTDPDRPDDPALLGELVVTEIPAAEERR